MIYLLQNLQINIFVDHITNHLRIAASVPGEGDTELGHAVECKHDQYEQHPHHRRRHRIHPCPFRGRHILLYLYFDTEHVNGIQWIGRTISKREIVAYYLSNSRICEVTIVD